MARAMLLRSYLGREAFAQAKSELWEREPWMRKYPDLFQRWGVAKRNGRGGSHSSSNLYDGSISRLAY
jgi:hypothetical protein